MQSGYEPARVHQLTQHTLEAIDTLDALSSSDPAAGEAMRTVRLTRSNLEDHWMPLLRDIGRSDIMVRWRASHLPALGLRSVSSLADALPDHLRPGGMNAVPIPAVRRGDLLRQLDRFDRWTLMSLTERRAGVDPVTGPTERDLAGLGRQLASWVRRDRDFAEELVELSASNLLVGELLGEADVPGWFAGAVVRRMALPNGPEIGTVTDVGYHRYAAALDTALAGMTDDPAACLDVLLDQHATHALASWHALDASVLSDFVVSGLYEAVEADPTRLADGHRALGLLARSSNGALETGMNAGMALGVAASLPGYLDTLAPAIEQEGATPVVIRAVDPPIEIGTYDELVDLFGAVIRVPEAQPAIGTAIAAYAFDTFERVGGHATSRPDVTHLADFADLIGDATRNEQAELVMTAAAEESRRRRFGDLIGSLSNALLLAGGATSVVRTLVGQALRMTTDWRAAGAPQRLADGQIPAHTYDLITVAAVSAAATDPSMRSDAALDDVTEAQWDEARRQLDAIEQLDDPRERMLAVGGLDHWITTSVPALSTYLLELRKMPGMDELKEGRNAVGAD